MQFNIIETNGNARSCFMGSPRGVIHTPAFMPVATIGTVKAVTTDELKDMGAEIILCNTYHLYLRPGADTVASLGGIHTFINWDGPVLTDSGGFQVFSLPHSREMHEDGARFQSYVDGKTHLLS